MRPLTPKEWRDVYYLAANAACHEDVPPWKQVRYERISQKIKEQHYVTKETP